MDGKRQKYITGSRNEILKSMLGVTRQTWLINEAISKTLKVNTLNDVISKYRHNLIKPRFWTLSIVTGYKEASSF
jgi:hypothetical protein